MKKDEFAVKRMNKRIFFIFFLSTLFAILSVGITLRYVLEKTTLENWKKRQTFVTLEFAPQCDFEIKEAQTDLEFIAKLPAFKNLTHVNAIDPSIKGVPENVEIAKRELFDRLREKSNRFSSFYILKPNADLYLIQPFARQIKSTKDNLKDRPYYKEVLRTKKTVISDSFISYTGTPLVVIIVPVLNEAGDITSILGGTFYLTDLSRLVSKSRIGNFDMGFIVDRNGHLIAHTDKKLVQEKWRRRYVEHPFVSKFLDNGADNDSKVMIGNCADSVDGEMYLTSFITLKSGWGLGLALGKETILSEIRPSVWRVTFLVSFIILIVGVMGWVFYQWMGKRWAVTQRDLVKQTSDRLERVKELNCIYTISKLVETVDISLEEIFQQIVETIPPAYRYPEIICARIVISDKKYQTKNFQETGWKQSSDIFLHDEKIGNIDVFSLKEKEEIQDGSFLKEERDLIDEIADRLKLTLQRITSDKRLRESENRFRTIFEQSPYGIALIDSLTGAIYEVNPTFAQIAGRTLEEMITLDWMRITHLDDVQEDLDNMALLNAEKITNFNLKKRYIQPDGSHIWVNMRIVPLEIEGKSSPHHLCMVEDITENKQAEAEKKKLESQLHQAQKMESIGTLAGGIAHDFNNILSSIIGFTELALIEAGKGTELEDDLLEVRKAGLRAKDLVKQILTFARQSEEAVKPIQIDIISKEVIKLIKSSIPSTIQINDKISSDSFIMGSLTQIHQVLMNLCTNAAYAMEEEGGILDVSVKDTRIDTMAGIPELTPELTPDLKPGEYMEIKVADTGTGISPLHIHTIFEPYVTNKPVGEGTGMGLAVVHGIVENYGGQIIVDSTIGKGTCFTIYLPIIKKRKTYIPSEKEDLPLGNETILFVDDEAPIAKMGSKVLSQLGYVVTTSTRSAEALELFRSKPNAFDLVVTDMTMPDMTGDKLAGELMKIRPDIPVVLCTGYSKKISEESAAMIGIKRFIHKPLINAELAKTVRNVLDASKDSA